MKTRYMVFDLETTGFDPETCHITELGYALFEEGKKAPLLMRSELLLVPESVPQEIVEITGITDTMLREFGQPPAAVFERFLDICHQHKVEFLAGHNAYSFDVPFFKSHLERLNLALPTWPILDTKIDLPLAYKPKSTSLSYMAADHGFLNPFAHRALFDVLTCGILIQRYPLQDMLAIINSPLVKVRAVVSYDNRAKASSRGFYWDAAQKLWLKDIRECHVENLRKTVDFQIAVLRGA